MSTITPCLWFNGQAEEAANFYVSLFPRSAVTSVGRYGPGMPFPEGTAMMVEFTLDGQTFQALNGGPHFTFSEAISMSVTVQDQAELDHYWHGLIGSTGRESQCGWLVDKYGVCWQIIPRTLGDLQRRGDGAATGRMFGAMMKMRKLDVAALEAAYSGKG